MGATLTVIPVTNYSAVVMSGNPWATGGWTRAAAPQRVIMRAATTARVAVEQASTFGWERYIGAAGRLVGMHTFGASAPLKALQEKFGFEPDAVVTVAKELLKNATAPTCR